MTELAVSDFLAHCVTEAVEGSLLEQLQNRSAKVVLAVFRMAKNALVHAANNEVLLEAAEQAAEGLRAYSAETGTPTRFTFAGDTVFVCGQLLKASRKNYETARELGEILARADVAEVTFDGQITSEDLLLFCDALTVALRDPDHRAALFAIEIPNLTVRKISPFLTARAHYEELPEHERILRFYATALVVMRHFFDQVAAGVTLLPHQVKRLAQRLVALADTPDSSMLGMTAMAAAHRDDAGRAVQSAILTVALARNITDDRPTLAGLVMAALLADVGRVRVAGPEGRDSFVPLADRVEATIPANTALVSVAMGGINPLNAMRTLTGFEVAWLERQPLLGPLWGGSMPPLVQAEVLATVRRLLEQMAPRDMRPGLSPVEALDALAADPATDRTLLRLLIRTVGIIPVGTVVELAGGAWAVVIGRSSNSSATTTPKVRVVTDSNGRPLDMPWTVDLGASPDAPKVARIVGSEGSRFNVAKALLEP